MGFGRKEDKYARTKLGEGNLRDFCDNRSAALVSAIRFKTL
jgi:hypothetical protein